MSYQHHRKLKQDIVDTLRDAPFINHATKKVGIARTTFYRWMKTDKIFEINVNGALQEGHKCMIELGESALFKKIKEGHFGAIKFYLENNHGNYMNKKYRVETLEKRNYHDSPAYAHARMPSVVAFTEEEMEYLNEVKDLAGKGTITPEQMQSLVDDIANGKFAEMMDQSEQQEQQVDN